MKKYKYYIVMFGFILTLCTSFKVIASDSWQDISCNNNTTGCNILSSGFTVPYCVNVNSNIDHALNCIRPSVTNNLSSIRGSSNSSEIKISEFEMRDVIELYCKSILGTGNSGRIYFSSPSKVNSGWDWQKTFDSHQSIFVYALCSSFKDKDENGNDYIPFINTNDGFSNDFISQIFKTDDLVTTLKLKQKSGGKDLCSLIDNKSIPDCDISIYATEIFSTIMSDIFKIKYAQVLNVDKSENFDSKEKVLDFMSGYFNYFKADFKDIKTQFPQTIDVLQSNQKYYKKVLDTVKIINNSDLADIALKEKCPTEKDMTGANFIACALHSSQGKGYAITPSFTTLIYNEIMNYRVFELYVNTRIIKKGGTLNEEERKKLEVKKSDLEGFTNLQINASEHAIRRFIDFNMTYPLHIGLLLYQEKMKSFRDKQLSPIVTFFYSLSEKLQNVQLPN